MLFYQSEQLRKFMGRKTCTFGIGYRLEPKLRYRTALLNVNMSGFVVLVGVKEESVRPDSQNCRHMLILAYNDLN